MADWRAQWHTIVSGIMKHRHRGNATSMISKEVPVQAHAIMAHLEPTTVSVQWVPRKTSSQTDSRIRKTESLARRLSKRAQSRAMSGSLDEFHARVDSPEALGRLFLGTQGTDAGTAAAFQ
eukprot:7760874-Pyramimonas_sp.AAC.1